MKLKNSTRVKKRLSYQFILSMLLIVTVLVGVILVMTNILLTGAFDRQIKDETVRTSESISQAVGAFVEGAYNLMSWL